MIKNILGELEQPIPDALPSGAIKELKEKHGYTRQTITKMLRGQTGKEENIREVLNSAMEILDKASRLQTETGQKIKEILNAEAVSA